MISCNPNPHGMITPLEDTNFSIMSIEMSHHQPPGRHDLPDSQVTIVNYLRRYGIQVPRAARRRWRRHALQRELISQKWIATHGAYSPETQTPVPQSGENTPTPTGQGLEPRRLAAVERVWELEQRPDAPSTSVTDWDRTDPDPTDLGGTAEYAAVLLDVFSRVKPVDDTQLMGVHRRLVGKALISVLELTRRLRVLQVAEDGEDEGLQPLPVQDDPALSVYAGCVVCYAEVADMLLMPCRHLTLCEVWACAICCGWGVGLM